MLFPTFQMQHWACPRHHNLLTIFTAQFFERDAGPPPTQSEHTLGLTRFPVDVQFSRSSMTGVRSSDCSADGARIAMNSLWIHCNQDNEGLDSDARQKSRSALVACSPIAYRTFGSDACCAWLKFKLFNALVNSRLLHCAQIVNLTASYIGRLQSVCMRALRPMCGEASSERTCHTDREILLTGGPAFSRLFADAYQDEVRLSVGQSCADCTLCSLWSGTQRQTVAMNRTLRA